MANVEDTVNKEYIDKHEAYLLLRHKAETYMLPATKEAYEKAAILIDSMKTHDVHPVKYGRWEVNGDEFYPFCSNCKYEPPKELIRCNALSLEPILTKYCPNCGSENGTRIYRGGENNG